MSPEALRRRMAHGNVYAAEKVDAALGNYFRVGNLTALRELALLWTADKVDDALQTYRAEHHIDGHLGGPRTRRRRADRGARGGDADPARGADRRPVVRRRPARGARHPLRRPDRRQPGAPRRAASARREPRRHLPPDRRGRRLRGAAGVRPSGERDAAGARRQPPLAARPRSSAGRASGHRRSATPATSTCTSSPMRRWAGAADCRGRRQSHPAPPTAGIRSGAVAPAAAHPRPRHRPRGDSTWSATCCCSCVVVVVVALVGRLPARRCWRRSAGSLLLNYYFTPPLHTFTISETNNVLALGVFVVVAMPGQLGGRPRRPPDAAGGPSDRRGRDAGHAGRQACCEETTALPALLERVREAFGLTSATLLERAGPAGAGDRSAARPWARRRLAGGGERRGRAMPAPGDADTEVPVGDILMLALRGGSLRAEDQRLVGAFAAQAAALLERHRLERGRGRGGSARRRRPDAHRAARRRRTRPADPARRLPRPR